MEPIVKALEKFLTRDLLYILGGASVIFSASYYWDVNYPEIIPIYALVFGIGLSYVIGYVIQEMFSFTPLLTTSHFVPNSFVAYLYKKFSNIKDFDIDDDITNVNAFFDIYPHLCPRQVEQLERIVTLKQVGSTIGSCWLVAAVFLFLKSGLTHNILDWFLAAVTVLFGCVLLILAWIKGTQQMHVFTQLKHRLDEKNN